MPFLVGGLAAGIGSGVIGAVSSSNAQNKALAQEQAAADLFKGLSPPDAAELRVELQRYQQTGQLTPRLQALIQQSSTNLSKISTDPATRAAQMAALQSLGGIAERGGRTLDQDAFLQKTQSDVAARNAGRIGAIKNQFAMRGMGQPSGLEMQAALEANQQALGQESDASLQASSDAQKAALQALMEEGTLGGQIRSQDFDQKAKVASAQDAIDRFNTELLHGTNSANTQIQNDAQKYNLGLSQDISNRNTDVANKQIAYNAQLPQQVYEDTLQKTGGEANALNGVATQHNNIGNTNAKMWSGIGQGLATAGVAGQMYANKNSGKSDDDEEDVVEE